MPLIFTQPYFLYNTSEYDMSGFATVSGSSAYTSLFLGDAFYRFSAGVLYRSADASLGFTRMNATLTTRTLGYNLCRNNAANRLFIYLSADGNSTGDMISYSDNNGATWTNRSVSAMQWNFGGMAANNDGVVIATCYYPNGQTAAGRTIRSIDNGLTYQNISTLTGVLGMRAMNYVERLNMFIGTNGAQLTYSTDNGDSWTRINLGAPAINFIKDTGVDLIASCGSGATLMLRRSTDGINWENIEYNNDRTNTLRAIDYIDGQYIVTHNTRNFYTSSDLVNWAVGTATFNVFTAVASNSQLILASNAASYIYRQY